MRSPSDWTAEEIARARQVMQQCDTTFRPWPVEVVGPVVFNLKACERIDIRE